jgi:hypothetical protein
MIQKNIINRREFIKKLGKYSSTALVGGYMFDSLIFSPSMSRAGINSSVFVAKNGSPAENVAKVIDMRFGGIENLVGYNDVIVMNPNGQWYNQGASNCACCMGLIDLILNRPGGFDGEIIFCENTQFQTEGFWTVPFLERNGPYNFNDMVAYYHSQGHSNVNGVRIWCHVDDPSGWPVVSGPQQGQGWVRPEWQSPTSDCLFYLAYPVILSPYSGRLIDLKNGVYDDGYEGQPALRFVKVPNLNNHGQNAEQDYAGVTSAIKSFLGITELENAMSGQYADGHKQLHTYGNGCHGAGAQRAFAAGEGVGAWMHHCRRPDIILTTAEWVGWGSRTGDDAAQARTVALAEDPVSLDYYMCKNVLWPLHPTQQYFNPDYDISSNMTRQTLNGCQSQGFGTTNEAEIAAYVYDFNAPSVFRFDIDRKIELFRKGQASQQEVLELIEEYNEQSK